MLPRPRPTLAIRGARAQSNAAVEGDPGAGCTDHAGTLSHSGTGLLRSAERTLSARTRRAASTPARSRDSSPACGRPRRASAETPPAGAGVLASAVAHGGEQIEMAEEVVVDLLASVRGPSERPREQLSEDADVPDGMTAERDGGTAPTRRSAQPESSLCPTDMTCDPVAGFSISICR